MDLENESVQNYTLTSLNNGQSFYSMNPFSTTCNVEADAYFLIFDNSAYIIDFIKNTCKIIANNLNCSNVCGSVCKEGIIYIFSSDNNSSSYALDLKKNPLILFLLYHQMKIKTYIKNI